MPPKPTAAPSRSWKYLSLFLMCTVLPWAAYLQFREKAGELDVVKALRDRNIALMNERPPPVHADAAIQALEANIPGAKVAEQPRPAVVQAKPAEPAKMAAAPRPVAVPPSSGRKFVKSTLPPVVGPPVVNGSKPLWGMQHKGTDAIMALACKYPVQFYKRFVGTLRKFGYEEDIVLAVSTVATMKPGVAEYLQKKNVLSYAFDVECAGKDNCRFTDSFLGYPDPREYRTFANIRYALYEYWLQQYEPRSYVLILDFRDTFFQGNPMGEHLPFAQRVPRYDLRVFAENFKVKQIETCVFNSMWVRKCFGKEAFDSVKKNAVLCSGSTYGSYPAITHYVRTMLASFDKVCWSSPGRVVSAHHVYCVRCNAGRKESSLIRATRVTCSIQERLILKMEMPLNLSRVTA